MSSSYEKKVVLIVGASRGIGKAIANQLPTEEFVIYGTSRTAIPNNSTTKFLELDLTDENSIKQAISKIVTDEGRLDVVVNSGAAGLWGPAEEVSIAQAQELFDVNFFGIMRVMHECLPIFRKQGGGMVVNISSGAVIVPAPATDLYSASKFALEGLSQSMAGYLKKHNIHIVLVQPGCTDTDFINLSPDIGKRKIADQPYGKMANQIVAMHKKKLSEGQDPKEIGVLVKNIICDPNPKLRYQTTNELRKVAENVLHDADGTKYLSDMQKFTEELESYPL